MDRSASSSREPCSTTGRRRPARLVPLPALATEQLSANALRVAAIRSRLKAAKTADGTWRSSKAWVDEYRATRYKRS
jgi:hypothetical protein